MSLDRCRFSRHVETVAEERGIAREWIERTLARPNWTKPDVGDPALTRAFAAIPERGGRILRVVYRLEDEGMFVVTAFFDRGARRP